MIPHISIDNSVDPLYLEYFKELKALGFSGDIEYSYAARLAVGVDNSVYQQLPQGVILPKCIKDVQLAVELAAKPHYEAVTFAPRGGGTGTNGQSLTPGVTMDMSRHMRLISDLNTTERTVHVEPGVIKDYLNSQIKKYGLFFSPELSTSNRATFGGMISTDASGQGSLKYGRTSRHVINVDMVLIDGSLVNFHQVSGAELEAKLAQQDLEGEVYRTVYEIVTSKQAEIEARFPKLNRFLTGYDLKHVYDPKTKVMDLSRIVCGSEGTLGFIVGAKLDLTVIPTFRALVNIKYDSFDSALRHAPVLVKAKALSVETVDSKVLNLARQDIVWYSVKDLITDVPGKDMAGINIVEFAGTDDALESQSMQALIKTLEAELKNGGKNGIIGYQVCTELKDVLAVYAMRKKAVGLLGNAEGDAKPIAFTEDTVVPPEHLADYIVEFRALLDAHHLRYGMFGHVDSGVLHVRPALDLCDPEQEKTLRTISDSVVALTAKYGGIMWGEHGRGYRCEYGPKYFGGLFDELRRVKAAFDPHNKINPGKICTPLGLDDAKLVSIDATKRGFYDRQIPITVRHSFRESLSCNGNGLCFNFDTTSPMCPTYKYLGDRIQSPKGRATLMREWLRQLELAGCNPLAQEKILASSGFSFKTFIEKCVNSIKDRSGFTEEVKQAMDCCLACKACKSQCPIKVDVPDFRARFFNLYYSRYLRPFGDIMAKTIEDSAPLMAHAPRFLNTVNSLTPVKYLIKHTLGFTDVPALSFPTLKQRLKETTAEYFNLDKALEYTESERSRYVILVQDAFTSSYDAAVIADFVRLVADMGRRVLVLPLKPNGKVQHIRGYLREFAKCAASTAEFLTMVAKLGIPMVGVDPAMTLCYRDEYKKILGDARGNFEVLLLEEWLLNNLDALKGQNTVADDTPYYLLAHCTQKTMKPTTHGDWQKIFATVGLKLTPIPVGCCGMAGLYGHTAANEERSKEIYRQNWAPVFTKYDINRCLVTGYSCREQVKRMEGVSVKHPLQVLVECFEATKKANMKR